MDVSCIPFHMTNNIWYFRPWQYHRCYMYEWWGSYNELDKFLFILVTTTLRNSYIRRWFLPCWRNLINLRYLRLFLSSPKYMYSCAAQVLCRQIPIKFFEIKCFCFSLFNDDFQLHKLHKSSGGWMINWYGSGNK